MLSVIFLFLSQCSRASIITLAKEALTRQTEGNFIRKRSIVTVNKVTEELQVKESCLKDSFNFTFSRNDKKKNKSPSFVNIPPIPCLLIVKNLFNRILTLENRFGYSEGIFSIGFSFTEGYLGEIRDQQRINCDGIGIFVRQKRY